MRAVYLDDININSSEILIDGDIAHHLINVVRIKNGEEILGLDGKGSVLYLKVNDLTKKKLTCLVTRVEFKEKKQSIDLAICLVKKDSMDLILKMAVECSIGKIFIVNSQYSQKYKLAKERLKNILVSAVEQSNVAYLPEIIFVDLQNIANDQYHKCIYFSSVDSVKSSEDIMQSSLPCLIIIGPEGGLSDSEAKFIDNWNNAISIHLPIGILRSTTAVPVAIGYTLAKLKSF